MTYRCARLLVPAAVTALAAGCGGSQPARPAATAEPAPSAAYSIGQVPVYAVLVQGSGGSWLFTTLTDSSSQPESGYLVRLNDLTPAFDTRAAECAPQPYPAGHRCHVAHPFRDKDSGVIDKLIDGGIAVGTAGKVTDIPSSYETTFDEAAFNRAVDEALVNSGLDNGRRPLLAAVESYRGLKAEAEGEFPDLQRRVARAQSSALSSYPVNIRPSITGATDYYGGDIDFAAIVELTPAEIAEPVVAPIDAPDVLPCEARNCLARIQVATTDLEARISGRRARVAETVSPESIRYTVRCGTAALDGYLLTVRCPSEVESRRNVSTVLPIEVEILSRDFESVYPRLDIADERLDVSVDGTEIAFSNPTDDYVTVTAQTVYYNSKVETSTNPIELAPGVKVTRNIDDFVSPAIDVESHYRQMTPDKAANASFRFGFAARYRVAETGTEDTLYAVGTFNVGCVIANRLQPGSCEPSPAVETGDVDAEGAQDVEDTDDDDSVIAEDPEETLLRAAGDEPEDGPP